jgi:hypothetical protein
LLKPSTRSGSEHYLKRLRAISSRYYQRRGRPYNVQLEHAKLPQGLLSNRRERCKLLNRKDRVVARGEIALGAQPIETAIKL